MRLVYGSSPDLIPPDRTHRGRELILMERSSTPPELKGTMSPGPSDLTWESCARPGSASALPLDRDDCIGWDNPLTASLPVRGPVLEP